MIAYHIYKNDGSGGPVDYSTIVATASGTTYATAALGAPSDNTYAVRAFDTTSGLEERNTDARVRIVVGTDSTDRTAVPNSPIGLTVEATAGGGCRVGFAYVGTGQKGKPTSWKAWLWTGTPSYSATPAATVPVTWNLGDIQRAVEIDLVGLSGGVVYQVGVRACNDAGDDGNTITATVTGKATGPGAVADLAGSAGYAGVESI